MRLVEARATVRDLLRAEIGTSVGEVTRRLSIDDAIKCAEPAVASPSGPNVLSPRNSDHHRPCCFAA